MKTPALYIYLLVPQGERYISVKMLYNLVHEPVLTIQIYWLTKGEKVQDINTWFNLLMHLSLSFFLRLGVKVFINRDQLSWRKWQHSWQVLRSIFLLSECDICIPLVMFSSVLRRCWNGFMKTVGWGFPETGQGIWFI